MSTGTSMSAISTSPATFFFLCSVLDGCSRFIVHWEIRDKMEESDVQTIIQLRREKVPGQTPRIISDNGPQFIAKDFKEFIRVCGMTDVTTSPDDPQSNGKIERWHKTLKGDCIRVRCPFPWTTPGGSSPITSSITTPSACTSPSARHPQGQA